MSSIRGVVMTIFGPVPAAELGRTHSHEHLAATPDPRTAGDDADLRLDDPRRVLPDLLAFREAGGGTIVECSTRDYGRRLPDLAWLARESGVRVVAATGFNKGTHARRFCEGRDADELAEEQVREVEEGVAAEEAANEGTPGSPALHAGFHKFGTGLGRFAPWEETAARAAARAHLRTGAPVLTHTEAGTLAEEQLDLLAEEGVPAENVILCHMDRNSDLELHRRLLRRGAYLSYDQVPKAKYGTAEPAIRLVVALAKEGLHGRLLLGGDFSRRSYFAGWGGEPGLVHLDTVFAARLREALAAAGLDAEAIEREIFVDNPARAFALRR